MNIRPYHFDKKVVDLVLWNIIFLFDVISYGLEFVLTVGLLEEIGDFSQGEERVDILQDLLVLNRLILNQEGKSLIRTVDHFVH